MSSPVIDLQAYIERISAIYEADTTLFPVETTGEALVTKVIRNKPPLEQSAPDGILPYILVFESTNPIRFLEKAGRDTRNVEGGSVYEVDIYSVVVTDNELTASGAQKKIHNITAAMRDALANNLRLANPADLTLDPLCRTHTRYEIPYLLRGDVPPTMEARNVVVRPQVYVSPRSP